MSLDDIDDIYDHLSRYEKLIGMRPLQREPEKAQVFPEDYGRKHKKPLILLPGRESFTISLRWQSVIIVAGISLASLGLAGVIWGISVPGGGGGVFAREMFVAGGLSAYSLGLAAIIVGTGNILKRKAESSLQKNLDEIQEQNRIIIELLGKITSELIFGF
jgi:hypothetical protein